MSKTCFVISPIGPDGSKIRRYADLTLRHILEPACSEHGYDCIRADQISDPGMITSQVITHIINDDMVIADLTSQNPNVFYELAIRHTLRKPVVQIISKGETIPFDVAHSRTIFVDLTDPDNVVSSRTELSRQIKFAASNPTGIDTPISTAIDIELLRQSNDPPKNRHLEILEQFRDIRNLITRLSKTTPSLEYQKNHHSSHEQILFSVDFSKVDSVGILTYSDDFGTFQEFLNTCFSDVMSAYVDTYTYGEVKWTPMSRQFLREVKVDEGTRLSLVLH